MFWREAMAVMAGGAVGCLGRFIIQRCLHSVSAITGFPLGVFVANVVGSFIIGFLSIVLITKLNLGPVWRAGIFVGFLGGLTTFSSFSLDTMVLLQSGKILLGTLNIAMSLTACLIATTLGLFIGQILSV